MHEKGYLHPIKLPPLVCEQFHDSCSNHWTAGELLLEHHLTGSQRLHLRGKASKSQVSIPAWARGSEAERTDQIIEQKAAKKAKECRRLCFLGDLLRL